MKGMSAVAGVETPPNWPDALPFEPTLPADLAERYAEWGWPATAVLTSDARPVLELRGFQDPEEFVALLRELIAERDAGKLQGRRPAPVAAPQNTDLLALSVTRRGLLKTAQNSRAQAVSASAYSFASFIVSNTRRRSGSSGNQMGSPVSKSVAS